MKRLVPILGFLVLLMVVHVYPVRGGEPTGKIGPRNPTMYRCVDKEDPRVIKVDRMAVEPIQEIANNDPSTLDSNCFVTTVSDFGFDTKDAALFEGHLDELENYCKDQEGEGEDYVLVPIEDTRIEGYVYEFHPDINNPGQWFPVPSRDVHVTAKGITFDIFWGTDEDGYYYFPNGFGAGPIILSMKLPPDAHAINPNVVINSTGLEETWTVFLGFYRGDEAPPDVTQLRAPNGSFLPFTTLEDLQTLSRCGYMDLPDVAKEILPDIAPPSSAEEAAIQIPDVGGTLPPDRSAAIIALAVLLVVTLPIAGILKIRRKA